MPIRPARQSDTFKMACHWREEAKRHRNHVERNPEMQLSVQVAYLRLAAIQERQADQIFQTIEACGPDAVVIE